MSEIKETTILEAFDRLDGLSDKQYEEFFVDLGEAQPELMSYIMEFSESLENEEASEDMVFLLAIIFISYEIITEEPVPHVDEDLLDKAEEKIIAQLQELEKIEGDELQTAFIEKNQRQPELMEYISDIMGGDEEFPSNFTEEEMGLAYTNFAVMVESIEMIYGR